MITQTIAIGINGGIQKNVLSTDIDKYFIDYIKSNLICFFTYNDLTTFYFDSSNQYIKSVRIAV